MANPVSTRTLGPLHFEDLEPRRFEDLVRQLRQLEGTGRSGSDDGFDVRGFEGGAEVDMDEDDERPDEAAGTVRSAERVWLIQCKREKAIGPKKLVGYLEDIPAEETRRLYGIVFAAACEFSKVARDEFRSKTREMGMSEAHLWGKAEIEDNLFQPKNDHLLFAYFGISLQVRRRALRTDVRARLATKRKLSKVLANWGTAALVRDAEDDRYPYLDEDEKKERFDRGRWYVYQVEGCRHNAVHLLLRRFFAFLDDNGIDWDYAEKMNDATPHQNPWLTDEEKTRIEARQAGRHEAFPIWESLPEKNRAWFETFLVLPYDNVLAVDESGDELFEGPHIYTVQFSREDGPFEKYMRHKLQTIDRWSLRYGQTDDAKRVNIFPRAAKDSEAD